MRRGGEVAHLAAFDDDQPRGDDADRRRHALDHAARIDRRFGAAELVIERDRHDGHQRRAERDHAMRAQPGVIALELAVEPRSEEHTSELQSLMRISNAVYCLKKKTPQST